MISAKTPPGLASPAARDRYPDAADRMKFYAHTAEDENGKRLPKSEWQLLKHHLRNVSDLAAKFADPFGASEDARVAGLLHDLGKYRNEFQEYLRNERGSSSETQHAIFGAAWAMSRGLPATLPVAGHHAGLHDCGDLPAMVAKPILKLDSILPELIALLEREMGNLPALPVSPDWVKEELSAEFYTRMLFSCLVDADRLDTASWPATPQSDCVLEADPLLHRICAERDCKASMNPKSSLGILRNRVFDASIEAAELPPGFFSLTVPTGGGKTLASMAFALAHAKAYGLRRIIVVIPYLSIIEQNAAEYRRILGDDIVLENHSGVLPGADLGEEEKSRLELVSENWDAPVVVTTSVQFLESLFSSSPGKCRKLHRISRSVVIFDEVQTLPAHLLKPTFNVFRELAANYGTSFVFSSATQPAFRKSAALPDGFDPNELREITPDPAELFRKVRRVNYHLPKADEVLDWPTLAQRMAAESHCLCVVNLTRHAKELWEELKRILPAAPPIHLSSAMCPHHRLALIQVIRERLKAGQPCRVVSTQLIEAGVDVDFPVVWRALGPLDSIVQVAGRCNREGRLPVGEVHVFRPVDHKLPRASIGPPQTGRRSHLQVWATRNRLRSALRRTRRCSVITFNRFTKWSTQTTPSAERAPFRKTACAFASGKSPARRRWFLRTGSRLSSRTTQSGGSLRPPCSRKFGIARPLQAATVSTVTIFGGFNDSW
ncbi:MAG: CRISPR-associated helicase Cas3' [Verrucomicrobia bacterium]|nr:CRISPR-associated helicase Cas3' [Verrucomicrobiota bacterium]